MVRQLCTCDFCSSVFWADVPRSSSCVACKTGQWRVASAGGEAGTMNVGTTIGQVHSDYTSRSHMYEQPHLESMLKRPLFGPMAMPMPIPVAAPRALVLLSASVNNRNSSISNSSSMSINNNSSSSSSSSISSLWGGNEIIDLVSQSPSQSQPDPVTATATEAEARVDFYIIDSSGDENDNEDDGDADDSKKEEKDDQKKHEVELQHALTQHATTADDNDNDEDEDEEQTTIPLSQEELQTQEEALHDKTSHYRCIVCGIDLTRRSVAARCSHLKACARENSVDTRNLLRLIRPIREPPIISEAAVPLPIDVPVSMSASAPVPGAVTALSSSGSSSGMNAFQMLMSSKTGASANTNMNVNANVNAKVGKTSSSMSTNVASSFSKSSRCSNSNSNAFNVLMNGSATASAAVIASANNKYVQRQQSKVTAIASQAMDAASLTTAAAAGTRAGAARTGNSYGKNNSKANPQWLGNWAPAYKKIQVFPMKQPIIVDGFQFAHKNLTDTYFLTHFHSDHYQGLNSSAFVECGTLYCTPTTAALVKLKIAGFSTCEIKLHADDKEGGSNYRSGNSNSSGSALPEARDLLSNVNHMLRYSDATGSNSNSNSNIHSKYSHSRVKLDKNSKRKNRTSHLTSDTATTAPKYHITPLQLEHPYVLYIGDINVVVTLCDANHCPGAAIILFEFPCGKTILHTGDFRFDANALLGRSPTLQRLIATCNQSVQWHGKGLVPKNMNTPSTAPSGTSHLTVYLDTTYCAIEHNFPPQELSIQAVLRCVRKELMPLREGGRGGASHQQQTHMNGIFGSSSSSNSCSGSGNRKSHDIDIDTDTANIHNDESVLFVFGAYAIGKERVYIRVAELLQCKIRVELARKRAMGCYQGEEWQQGSSDSSDSTSTCGSNWKFSFQQLTTDLAESNIWVLPMAHVTLKNLDVLRQQRQVATGKPCRKVVGFVPTGWTHGGYGNANSRWGGKFKTKDKDKDKNCVDSAVPLSVAEARQAATVATNDVTIREKRKKISKLKTNVKAAVSNRQGKVQGKGKQDSNNNTITAANSETIDLTSDVVYSIPYSEHSSFPELVHFIQLFRPRHVVPTVGTTVVETQKQLQVIREYSGVYANASASASGTILRVEAEEAKELGRDGERVGAIAGSTYTGTAIENNKKREQGDGGRGFIACDAEADAEAVGKYVYSHAQHTHAMADADGLCLPPIDPEYSYGHSNGYGYSGGNGIGNWNDHHSKKLRRSEFE